MSQKQAKRARVKEKVMGIRYFTYYIEVGNQAYGGVIPFVHDLRFELDNSKWRNDPIKKNDLLTKGETSWVDNNGARHIVKVENFDRGYGPTLRRIS